MAQISPVPFARQLGAVAGAMARVTDDWRRWFQEVKDRVDTIGYRIGAVGLPAQTTAASGSVSTAAALAAGRYRVSWLVRVTQAATTSGSAELAIGATSDGVATTQSLPAVANVLGSVQSGVVLVDVDAGTPITYAVAYSSVGATPLRYSLSLFVEALP